jgi:hypothetical protein
LGLLTENQQQMEDLVRQLGYEPSHNYLLVFKRMNNGAKVAVNLLLRIPSLGTSLVEKRHLLVFTPRGIVVHRLKKNGITEVCEASKVKNFRVRDGANNSVVIDFDYEGESFSFYSYKDFSMRMKYVAENLAALSANNFMGYAA